MSSKQVSAETSFASEFLRNYLKGGIGSMPKSDIDALVMYLVDKFTTENGRALGTLPNQVASERLRAPLSKIKRLRYEGMLKFGGRPEDEARYRFVRGLSKAGLEFEKADGAVSKIVFVVEDMLAKNWIQGMIKEHRGLFDGSFNSEIIKVDPLVFFKLLDTLLPKGEVAEFKEKYETLLKKTKREEIVSGFKSLVGAFAKAAVGASGAAATAALLSLPVVGT